MEPQGQRARLRLHRVRLIAGGRDKGGDYAPLALAEAILLLAQWDSRAAHAVLAGELLVGLALPPLALGRRPKALLIGVGLTFVQQRINVHTEVHVRVMSRYFGQVVIYQVRRKGAPPIQSGVAFMDLVKDQLKAPPSKG